MKNLKMKLIAFGILSTVVISTTPVFAANYTSTKPGIVATNTSTTPGIVATTIIQYSFNYGPNGGPSADAIISGGGVIKLGDIGVAVKEIQSMLNQKGYPCGAVDGIFGANTKTAVMNFQSARSLARDGIVGQQTWNALNP
jgi:peptidoglycan hydrolase-like protein with peptidoglycan-binding domain